MTTMRSNRFVLLAAALVALALAAAPAGAVPLRWDFGGWLHGILSSVWAENGCSVNPSGLCGETPAPVQMLASPNGCSLDPDGRCITAPAPFENGCNVDPDGICKQ